MDKTNLTDHQRKIRGHVRNFLMTATSEELKAEFRVSVAMGDEFRAACVRELIDESKGER